MKFLIVNGPNMNMLGIREPDIYGNKTMKDLEAMIWAHCEDRGVEVEFFQSNSEGAIIDAIQEALTDDDGIVINPAAYAHTSIAIADAIRTVRLPAVEVHISDLATREPYRRHSYVSEACIQVIMGRGFQGYLDAIDALILHLGGELE